MYKRILVPLDATACDRAILDHVKALAKIHGSTVVVLHVADGWAARRFGKDAVSDEITRDMAYLEKVTTELEQADIPVTAELAYGDPKKEILKWVEDNHCDLIAMSTHGHRFVGDLLYGATASHVQHRVDVPVLLLRSRPATSK